MASKHTKRSERFELKSGQGSIVSTPASKPSEPVGTVKRICTNRSRNKNFIIRFSAEEFSEVKQKMEELNLSRPELILRAVRRTNITATGILAENLAAVCARGEKLNDVAHQLNLLVMQLEQKKYPTITDEKWAEMRTVVRGIYEQNIMLRAQLRHASKGQKFKKTRGEKQNRKIKFNIRVSEKELKEIETKLELAAMDRADFLLFFVRGRNIFRVEKLDETLDEMIHQSTNLCQIINAADMCKVILKKQKMRCEAVENVLWILKKEAELVWSSSDALEQQLIKMCKNTEV